MIAPITDITISEHTVSNNQSFELLPIQMTSIDEDVTMKPSHTRTAVVTPVAMDGPYKSGDVEVIAYSTASPPAVMRLTTKFQIS